MPKAPVCDFCSSTKVRWTYPARNFVIEGPCPLAPGSCGPVLLGSSGGWTACNPCHHLIERRLWLLLAERTIALMDLPVKALDSVAIVQTAFQLARKGLAVPVPEGVKVEVSP